MKLRQRIAEVINLASAENGSDTPDFLLADYLVDCLNTFDKYVNLREQFWGREPKTSFKQLEQRKQLPRSKEKTNGKTWT